MKDIITACLRALRSLARRDILWHLLWPVLASLLLWLVVGILSWSTLVAGLVGWLQAAPLAGEWISGSEMATGALVVLVKIMLLLTALPLTYVTAALLVATVALPLMLERVGRSDYRDLEMRRGGNNLGSALNAITAGAIFLVGLLLSLPFWLFPGFGLLASLALTAWLNQRAFRYDALMLHADRDELAALPREYRGPMFGLGVACAALAYVPFVNLFAPAFCGLAFVHYLLEALRRRRNQADVVLLDPALPSP